MNMKFNTSRAVGFFNLAVGTVILAGHSGQTFSVAIAVGISNLVLGCILLGVEFEDDK